ncbi:hypothetical protein Droror1_Dr00002258 [Drosera rotundifolia]
MFCWSSFVDLVRIECGSLGREAICDLEFDWWFGIRLVVWCSNPLVVLLLLVWDSIEIVFMRKTDSSSFPHGWWCVHSRMEEKARVSS